MPVGGAPKPVGGWPIPIGRPLPAGLAIPGPGWMGVCDVPAPEPTGSLDAGVSVGGPSTDRETIVMPRRMMRPRVRFSSTSVVGALGLDFVALRFVRRNSSVSARTTFMCLSNASKVPVNCLLSFNVTRIL